MNKVFASVLALGLAVASTGCPGGAGLPGECKFAKGEVAASVQGDAKAFLDAAMDLKKTVDGLEGQWDAEIKAMAGELKVEQASEDAVLAKINANVSELKAQGECTVTFDFKAEASASGSAEGSGKAATGEGAQGSGSATGSAAANVEINFDVKCKAEAKVKATLDVTTASIKGHFPKLIGISIAYKDLAPKVKAVMEQGDKAMAAVKSDLQALPEVKCAVEAVTGIKVEARAEFSVKASASAKGEAKAG